jgi:hypothetical protein
MFSAVFIWRLQLVPPGPSPLVEGPRGDGKAVYGNSLATLLAAFATPSERLLNSVIEVRLITMSANAYSDIV